MSDEKAITIVGLGPGSFSQLSLAAWEALQRARVLFLRTAIHPTVAHLQQRGIAFTSFDSYYETAETFEAVYERIADTVIQAAAAGPVTYAVPGHPLVGEASVQLILVATAAAGLETTIIPSMSALDAIFSAARLDPSSGLQVLDALTFTSAALTPGRPALFLQLYSRLVASQLKIALLDLLDADTPVLLVHAAGVPGQERLISCPLHELDRQDCLDHLTSLYLPACDFPRPDAQEEEATREAECARKAEDAREAEKEAAHSLAPLVNVMAALRGEHGCPWDRKQTHESLQRYLIEEAYEVLEAIEAGDMDALCEELGDVLLQVVFHAQLAAETGAFTIDDVVAGITAKMRRRHPHVFADTEAATVSDVLRNWEAIKQAEKAVQGTALPESLLDGVPRHLPALMRAEAVQQKAAKVGFEWDDVAGALDKVAEETKELREAAAAGSPERCRHELGDLLFALVNVARYLQVDPEAALHETTAKFMRRFRHIERRAAETGRELTSMTVAEMDRYWDEAKTLERGS
jgi:tetrapyrrole methylase family protein/MazG family protein